MASTVATTQPASHRLLPEKADRFAVADLRKAEAVDYRAAIGGAVERVRLLCGLSLKEFADAVHRDERQVARWITGAERPQFDALFAVARFRQPLVLALAELAGAGVEVTTVVTVRRQIA